MRFIVGNILYDFKVAQDEAMSLPSLEITESDSGEFHVDVKFRKFRARSQSTEIELRRSLRLPRAGAEASMAPIMADTLQELEVSAQVREDMATHFKFYLERLSLWNSNQRMSIPVTVSVDVREISPEMAAGIQSRMEVMRIVSNRPAPADVTAPAKNSAVEALERERVTREGEEEERECGICLERYAVGEEVIKMPCFHVYHTDCITRWLQKNHFCPFCHFKLPC